MVLYYGRAKQRVGSVNTTQLGLKMSGCPSKIGKSGYLLRYQSRRSKCNLKFYGPVRYHGIMWSFNKGKNTVPRQKKCAVLAGGVGNINAPRFKCGINEKLNNFVMKKYYDPLFLGNPIPISLFITCPNNKICVTENNIPEPILYCARNGHCGATNKK